MEANQMQPGARHQCGQALQELQRRHDDVGGAVAVGAFELQHHLAGAIAFEPLVGNGGAGDGAAQAFELLALMGTTTYCRMLCSKPYALAHSACEGCAARPGSVCKLSTLCPARGPSAMR